MEDREDEQWGIQEMGGFFFPRAICCKQRMLDRDSRRLANYVSIQCSDLGIDCELGADNKAKRTIKPGRFTNFSEWFRVRAQEEEE